MHHMLKPLRNRFRWLVCVSYYFWLNLYRHILAPKVRFVLVRFRACFGPFAYHGICILVMNVFAVAMHSMECIVGRSVIRWRRSPPRLVYSNRFAKLVWLYSAIVTSTFNTSNPDGVESKIPIEMSLPTCVEPVLFCLCCCLLSPTLRFPSLTVVTVFALLFQQLKRLKVYLKACSYIPCHMFQ